jgi:hypothetical protein
MPPVSPASMPTARAGYRDNAPPAPPALAPAAKKRIPWWRLLLRGLAMLMPVASGVAIIIGYMTNWHQTRPVVYPPTVPGEAQPLSAPFVIKNDSFLTFWDVTTDCHMDRLQWDSSDPTTLSEMNTTHPQPDLFLAPGGSVITHCALITDMRNIGPIRSANLKSARAQIVIRYKTLLIPREYQSGHFCWVPTPPSGRDFSRAVRAK